MGYQDDAYEIYHGYLQDLPRDAVVLFCGLGKELLGRIKAEFPACHFQMMEIGELQTAIATEGIFAVGSLDAIFLGRVLEYLDDAEYGVLRLKEWLKNTGVILAIVGNVRHWSVYKEWCSGHWHYGGTEDILSTGVRRLFALPEIIALCQMAGFEHVDLGQVLEKNKQMMKVIENIKGIVNENNDLDTKFWVVRIRCMEEETMWLRQYYTPAIRAELVRILRRVDAGIDVEANIAALWKMCQQEKIDGGYLVRLIRNSMLSPECVLQRLAVQIEGE